MAKWRSLLIRVEYSDGEDESYTIPLAVAAGEQAEAVLRDHKEAVLARLEFRDESWMLLYSALIERSFSDALLTAVLKRSKFKGSTGRNVGRAHQGVPQGVVAGAFESRTAGAGRWIRRTRL